MPAHPAWLHRVSGIHTEVRNLPVPVVDRATVERMFGLKRRQAIELMHRFGGYQAGRTFLLDRAELLRSLEVLMNTPEFDIERRRKESIANMLDEARRTQSANTVRITVPVDVFSQHVDTLPEQICFSDGILTIRFKGVQDLLVHLVELSHGAPGRSAITVGPQTWVTPAT